MGKRKLVIELPVPLITWNRLLAMQHFERMKYRHLVHQFLFTSILYGSDWPTQMEFQGKQQSTPLLFAEYFMAIRPSKSNKSRLANLRANRNGPTSRSRKPKKS